MMKMKTMIVFVAVALVFLMLLQLGFKNHDSFANPSFPEGFPVMEDVQINSHDPATVYRFLEAFKKKHEDEEVPASYIRPALKEIKLLGGRFTTEGGYGIYISVFGSFFVAAKTFNWVPIEIFCRHTLVSMASLFVNFSIFWYVQIQHEGKEVSGAWYNFLEFIFMFTWGFTLLVLAHVMVAHVTLVWFQALWVRMVAYCTPREDVLQ